MIVGAVLSRTLQVVSRVALLDPGRLHTRVLIPVNPRSLVPQTILYWRLRGSPRNPAALHVYVIGVFGIFGEVDGFAVNPQQLEDVMTFTFAGSVLLFEFESQGFLTVAILE